MEFDSIVYRRENKLTSKIYECHMSSRIFGTEVHLIVL